MSSRGPLPPPDPVLVLSGKCDVTSLTFMERDILFTGHQNGQIQEWNISIQRSRVSWSGHSDTVLWLACVQGHLISQGRDGLVKAWTNEGDKTDRWTPIAQIPSAALIFCNGAHLDFTQGSLLAIPSDQTSCVSIHNIPSSNTDRRFSISSTPSHTLKPASVKGYGMCMKMCPINGRGEDRGNLLVGYESGCVALWNALNGEMIHNVKSHDDSVMCLACWLSPVSGQTIGLSASVSNSIQRWTISDDESITKDNSVSVTNEGFNAIAVRTDGRIFATGGWDGRGRVFGLKKLRPLAVLTYHKESINCVAFSPDNELVLASKDGYITFWDVYKNS